MLTAFTAPRCADTTNPANGWLVGTTEWHEEEERLRPTPKARAASSSRSSGKHRVRLVAAPIPPPSTSAADPLQRVLQVCVGESHGILLTGAGIAFTWGDNRCGQLGRKACRIEEDGQPFPLLDLLEDEVVQVASGLGHCLALTSSGLVFAWGRNKAGQLGHGGFRDGVMPERVRHAATGEDKVEVPLGQGTGKRITKISAGGNSSLASSVSSEIWQWGAISTTYSKHPKNTRLRRGDKTLLSGSVVLQDRPHKVFEREHFRSKMRRERVSISATGCRVLDSKAETDRLKDLVELARQLQESVYESRADLGRMAAEKKKQEEKKNQAGQDGTKVLGTHLEDTIASLKMEVSELDDAIEEIQKKMENCAMRQKTLRQELQELNDRSLPWQEQEDEIELAIIEVQRGEKGNSERKARMEQLEKVKGYQRAAANSRMALLEQRGHLDKEKQLHSRALDQKRQLKRNSEARLRTVTDLGKALKKSTATSDMLLSFLRDEWQQVHKHFEGRGRRKAFLQTMKELEEDENFIDNVEAKMKVVLGRAPDKEGSDRPTLALSILQDLLSARRALHSLLQDRWGKDDHDVSRFVEGAKKPKPFVRGRALGDLDSTQQSLPKPALDDGPLRLDDGNL